MTAKVVNAISTIGWGFAMLAWILLNAGCTPASNDFRAVNLGDEEAAAFTSAAESWCNATRGEFCPALNDGASNTVTMVSSFGPDHIGTVGHYTNHWDGAASIQLKIAPVSELRITAMHELGHHYGCIDADNPQMVMHWALNTTEVVDVTDADLACETY